MAKGECSSQVICDKRPPNKRMARPLAASTIVHCQLSIVNFLLWGARVACHATFTPRLSVGRRSATPPPFLDGLGVWQICLPPIPPMIPPFGGNFQCTALDVDTQAPKKNPVIAGFFEHWWICVDY